jgi:fatty acid desaturase
LPLLSRLLISSCRTSSRMAKTVSYALTTVAGDDVRSLTNDAFESDVEASWFSATLDRNRMKDLMKRSDAAGYRHFGVWIVLLVGSAIGIVATWLSLSTVAFLVVYGLAYSMSDHHAHELSHGTPFKSRRVNEALYHLNGFMTLHEIHYWRWSHTRHHTDTLLVGRDPEIAIPRPPKLWKVALDFFFIPSGLSQLRNITRIALTGAVKGDGEHFVPRTEVHKIVGNSRVYVAIFAATIVSCFVVRSPLPVVLVVTPRFWGGPFAQLFNITQHAGLAENVHDHRFNTRTVLMNRLFRFMYMNMNYHVEHHMFPMVPFYALPKLHEQIRDQLAPPSPNTLAAWRELMPALRAQKKDITFALPRVLSERQ